jgi:predicted permease
LQVFTKIASQLTPDKLPELAIIPVIFVVQTVVSYLSGTVVSKLFRFKKRPRLFVTAMAVFGNSNSLPISLIISLSKTIPSLRWDKIPGDNDDEVAARGILYLMIFQQLGQILRWSWGYNYLLAKPEKFAVAEGGTAIVRLENGEPTSPSETGPLLVVEESDSPTEEGETTQPYHLGTSGTLTPQNGQIHPSTSSATLDELHSRMNRKPSRPGPEIHVRRPDEASDSPDETGNKDIKWSSPRSVWEATKSAVKGLFKSMAQSISRASGQGFSKLPKLAQITLQKFWAFIVRAAKVVWEFMNPPLWAMLLAIFVASVPKLQHYFFTKGTFINTSVSRAVEQSGGVAVPLILVVLGANLARNTLPPEQRKSINDDDPKLERKLLIACLVSRMLLPTLIMAPILALAAKYVPISILDDPVFVVVAFLLTGAPSALQLAQICQLNNVYVPAMTQLLFQSYVIWYVQLNPPG